MTKTKTEKRAPLAAEVFLRALAEHGIDHFFCNPGTDFAPIVEAFSRAQGTNAKMPQPVVVPHENVAMAMAHGAWLTSRRPQAVMVHTSVGTGNTINNLINVSRDRAPLLLAAGRSPIAESGAFGARNGVIHWGQEMFDQAGMVREMVKWDYELRTPAETLNVVRRAHEVMMTSPMGPVYLTLPREPLSASVDEIPASLGARQVPGIMYPDPQAIETLADWIVAAKRPLVISTLLKAEAFAPLAELATKAGLPVVSYNPRTLCFPPDHEMNAGYEPAPLLGEADLVIVIESDVPWMPSLTAPPAHARVVHIGEEPTYPRYPMRSYPSDLAIKADSAATLQALIAAVDKRKGAAAAAEARRKLFAPQFAARREKVAKEADPVGGRITRAYLNRMVSEKIDADTIVFNEYWGHLDFMRREKPGTWFNLGSAGGLGWAMAAALGAKMVQPDKFVVATVGDGAYMFTNPLVCHWMSAAHKLPVLGIICNNSRYGAVRSATLSMFKDQVAGESDGIVLADLNPSPPFEEFVKAQGGYGERVEDPAELPKALDRAKNAVLREGRQALLNVICPG